MSVYVEKLLKKIQLEQLIGQYKYKYRLSAITRLKVGGEAEFLFIPKHLKDLQYFLQEASKEMPVTVIGNCSNILVRDGGIEGITIKLGENFSYVYLQNNQIIVGGSTLNYHLVQFTLSQSIEGLEFLTGVPGSIGGSIAMNAGCYGSEVKDNLLEITYINKFGQIKIKKRSEILFSYRKSDFSEWGIVIEAKFYYQTSSKNKIQDKIQYINYQRKTTQPYFAKTAGSTFINPDGRKAWQLIDSVGLRGYRIGDAQFSEQHCNFIINLGAANAKEIEELGLLAIQKVQQKHGIKMLWEVKRLGNKN